MTYTTAMTSAQQLKAALQRRGVTVSIELQVGAAQNGVKRWDRDQPKVSVMSHHTVSRPSQGLTPCLALVKRGRVDVPGPLCNGYGGYDLVYRIITMDIANHSGAGGPMAVPGYVIPKDMGRYYIWGTEYEGGLEDWTPQMREFMARANAGLLDYFGLTINAHVEHKTWAPTRKIDRLHYTTESGRNEIIVLGGKPGTITPVEPVNPWAGKDPKAVYPLGSRVLRMYSAGTDVSYVQSRVGADPDGYYGSDTTTKVRVWQKANGLVDDGICGTKTWGVLLGTTPAPPAPKTRKPIYPDGIRRGSTGGLVRLAQEILKRDGCYAGKLDNSFGPIMESGVYQFQKKWGLTRDGYIWKETWATLLICNGVLRLGSSGPEVRLLQVYLGWMIGASGHDGSFGPATDTRTREMQRYLQITDDGAVYTQTANALKR